MNIEKEREAFEQWVSGFGLNVSTADGLYRSHVMAWMWNAWKAALQSSEVQAWKRDAERMDWLADPKNSIGNVQLPIDCVKNNLHSLRGAIDEAKEKK